MYSAGKWISGVCMGGVICLITVEVVARKLFGFSTLMADEYSGYLLVAMVSFGLADTLSIGGHVSVEILTERLGVLARGLVGLATNLVGFGFAVLWSWHSLTLVMTSYNGQITSIMQMRTPLYLTQIPLLIGVIVLSAGFVEEVIKSILFLRDPSSVQRIKQNVLSG